MRIGVPFFRPDLSGGEISEVVATLKSGWLTTGPRVKRFEEGFRAAVGGRHAVAVNSATAALHLSVEALGLKAGQAVLVPTMTFAAIRRGGRRHCGRNLASVPGDRDRYYREVLLPEKLEISQAYLSQRAWKSDVAVLVRTLGRLAGFTGGEA